MIRALAPIPTTVLALIGAMLSSPAVTAAPAAAFDPAAVAGTWSLTSADKVCHLSLGVSRTEDGKAYTVDPGDCVEAGFPHLRGWTPEGEGLGLQLDGGAVLVMAREDAGRFSGKAHDGRPFVLARNR